MNPLDQQILMDSFEGLMVLADWNDDMGLEAHAAGVRSIAWSLQQAESLIGEKLIASGSRRYGAYFTDRSDWDWIAPNDIYDARDALIGLGWSTHSNSELLSLYGGGFNLIIPREQE